MILLVASAFAGDLCAVLSQNLRAAPAAFASAAPLPGATCSAESDGYRCVYPLSVESDQFPSTWHRLQSEVGACRVGALHVEATEDAEILYLRSTWTAPGAVVEMGVAGVGTGIEVYVGRVPKS